ncbi:hypothetical protein B0H16DRAFT_1694776 [Mycena metata]|uniref:Uncharacterized protein n=1 Tax=Mycena metata TaxID=1033252 RepID=A0AAD7MYY9_9AGAR|nr:hypothetical protein B0H16DRAFT_1694776 [Mycena metata]
MYVVIGPGFRQAPDALDRETGPGDGKRKQEVVISMFLAPPHRRDKGIWCWFFWWCWSSSRVMVKSWPVVDVVERGWEGRGGECWSAAREWKYLGHNREAAFEVAADGTEIESDTGLGLAVVTPFGVRRTVGGPEMRAFEQLREEGGAEGESKKQTRLVPLWEILNWETREKKLSFSLLSGSAVMSQLKRGIRIHIHDPPLSAETKGKIEHATLPVGADSLPRRTSTNSSRDETEGDAALIEAEFELALDILDSEGEISSAEPAAPANLNDPTAADAPVTLGPHGLSDDLPATVKPTPEFIAPPIMKLWKLKFNPKYPAIYCDRCQQFVPLDDISPHLSNGWMLKEYSEPGKLKGKQHEKVKKVPTDLASQIRQELAATPETGVSIETRFPDS